MCGTMGMDVNLCLHVLLLTRTNVECFSNMFDLWFYLDGGPALLRFSQHADGSCLVVRLSKTALMLPLNVSLHGGFAQRPLRLSHHSS